MMTTDDWEQRIEALWDGIDAYAPADFCARIDTLAADDPVASLPANYARELSSSPAT